MFMWAIVIITLNVFFGMMIPWIYMFAPLLMVGGLLVLFGLACIFFMEAP